MSRIFKKIALVSSVLRLIFAPIIFISVWFAAIATLFLDTIDGEFFKRAGFSHPRYTFYDKLLDYYWYLFIVVYIFLNNISGKELFLIFFLFRSCGHALFHLTKNQRYFFFFPNFFEILFYFYLFTLIFPQLALYLQLPQSIFLILAMTPVVLIREFFLHIKKINLSQRFFGEMSAWREEANSSKSCDKIKI